MTPDKVNALADRLAADMLATQASGGPDIFEINWRAYVQHQLAPIIDETPTPERTS